MKTAKILFALVALLPILASAQGTHRGVDHRQHKRSVQSVRRSALTRIREREARIRVQRRRNGRGDSRARTQARLNRTSRILRNQKHDRRHRSH